MLINLLLFNISILFVFIMEEILDVINKVVVFLYFVFKVVWIVVFDFVLIVDVELFNMRIGGFFISVFVIDICCFCLFDRFVVFCVKLYW